MSWLRRDRSRAETELQGQKPMEEGARAVSRSAPGIAALFAGLREDRSHAVLDLGSASEGNLQLYGRFAGWIRFAELLTDPPHGEALARALEHLPPVRDRPYDLVLIWNLLDLLRPEERPLLIHHLIRLTGPGARFYLLVDASGQRVTQPLRFTLKQVDQVFQEAVAPPRPAQPQLLPAGVERLLHPLEIAHAFTLRRGWREYVAQWRRDDPRATTWWTR